MDHNYLKKPTNNFLFRSTKVFSSLVIQFLLVWPLNFVRLAAIIHFEANEPKHFVDANGGTIGTVWHGGIFDSIKNAFFWPPYCSVHTMLEFLRGQNWNFLIKPHLHTVNTMLEFLRGQNWNFFRVHLPGAQKVSGHTKSKIFLYV